MIQSSHFIVALVVTQHIMNYAKPIYQALQKADCDIVKAYIDANTCKKVFRKQREDNTFRNLWGKIVALADSVDEVIEIARTARRMAHRSTAGEIDATAMQYFKVNVFFPFIDHCLMQLDLRFPADKTGMFLASKLMPLTIATMTPAEIVRVFDWYSADLPQNATFQQEIHCWTFCQDLKTSHPPYPMLSFRLTRIITQIFTKSSTFYYKPCQ